MRTSTTLHDGRPGWEQPAWVLVWGGVPVGAWDSSEGAEREQVRLTTDYKKHFPWKAPPAGRIFQVRLVTRKR